MDTGSSAVDVRDVVRGPAQVVEVADVIGEQTGHIPVALRCGGGGIPGMMAAAVERSSLTIPSMLLRVTWRM